MLPELTSALSFRVFLIVLFAAQFGSVFAWHRYPQTVFYNEFFSALAAVCVGGMIITANRVAWRISTLVVLVAGGIFTICLWIACSRISIKSSSVSLIVYGVFGLWCALSIQFAGANGRRREVVDLCAWGILVAACIHCLVSTLQLIGVAAPGWVMPKLLNSAYGNIAQENHFADLLWLGLVSLFHLWLCKKFPTVFAAIVAAVICVFSTLSVSRSVWLYTVAVPLVALLYTRGFDPEVRRRVWMGAGAVFVMSVLSQIWLAFGGAQVALGVTSAIDRVTEAGSNGQRMFDWMIAWKTALAHPLTGVGPGMFSWQTALGSIGLPPVNYVRIGENAHNTVLHFAAEFGVLFIVLALGLISAWLWRRWKEVPTLESLWGLGIITVLGAHSLVEYPLWYAYFLVPLACAIGVIDAGDERLPALRFNARWLLIPVVLGALVLGSTWHDYRRLEAAYKVLNEGPGAKAGTLAELDAVGASISQSSLMAPQAAILRLRAWRTTDLQRLPEIVQVCDESLKIKPQYNSFTACVAAYTLSGRKAEADQINEIVCGAFAPVHSKPFIEYAQKLYAPRGWDLPPKARCY